MHADELRNRLNTIAGKLKRLTETVESAASTLDRGHTSYAAKAADVQYELLWGLANMDLPGLVTPASAADVARKTGA